MGGLDAILKVFLWCFCAGSNAAVVYEAILLIFFSVKESTFFSEEGTIYGQQIYGYVSVKSVPKCIISTSKALTFFSPSKRAFGPAMDTYYLSSLK